MPSAAPASAGPPGAPALPSVFAVSPSRSIAQDGLGWSSAADWERTDAIPAAGGLNAVGPPPSRASLSRLGRFVSVSRFYHGWAGLISHTAGFMLLDFRSAPSGTGQGMLAACKASVVPVAFPSVASWHPGCSGLPTLLASGSGSPRFLTLSPCLLSRPCMLHRPRCRLFLRCGPPPRRPHFGLPWVARFFA